MKLPNRFLLWLCFILMLTFQSYAFAADKIILGDERIEEYLPKLSGKRVAVFCNHSAMIGQEHLLDILLKRGQAVTIIFAPEHGVMGDAPAGKAIDSGVDSVTNIPIFSLYKATVEPVKPTKNEMEKFDVLVIDIQDIGLRYYTYYMNICDLLEVCAEYDKEVILLDRPNPNGHYVDGPIISDELKGPAGRLPIPVVHGMTLGELMNMAIGEGWLNLPHKLNFTVIPCKNYTHGTAYELPLPPSPNLPNMKAVYLYPSLCPFEGTAVSVGRGTSIPFQCFGHPALKKKYHYKFIPKSVKSAPNPLLMNRFCYGVNFSGESEETLRHKGLDLTHVVAAYKIFKSQGLGDKFFTQKKVEGLGEIRYFDMLMGQTYVRESVIAGKTAEEIRAMWQDDVKFFIEQRKPYLLYEE